MPKKLSCRELEEAIPLREAAKYFPSKPSIWTLRRWSQKGLKGGAKLRVFRSGGTPCTTRAAIEDFVAEASIDPTGPRRQIGAASELAAMGI